MNKAIKYFNLTLLPVAVAALKTCVDSVTAYKPKAGMNTTSQIVTGLIVAALMGAPAVWGADVYHLSFDDEFNSLQLSTGPASFGWLPTDQHRNHYYNENGEQQYYSSTSYNGYNPFSVQNGILSITARPTPAGVYSNGKPYVSGEITTAVGDAWDTTQPMSKGFSQQYGYFEIRAKLPAGKGLWPAFWLLPADGSHPPEYDIFEVLGDRPSTIYQTAHWQDQDGWWYNPQHVIYNINTSTDFHTYGFLWTADSVTWYVDGVATFTQPNMMDQAAYILINLAVGGYWPGNPDDTTLFPAAMQIDYMRVYSADPNVASVTPQSGYSINPATLPIQVVPEPGTLGLLMAASGTLLARAIRRRK